MLETTKYVRKPFYIDAVRVTLDNLYEVAAWCDGDIRTDSDHKKYVKVRVHRPLNDRQTKAYVGDWVLYAGTGFKVYTPKAFLNSFEQASVETNFVSVDIDDEAEELMAVVEQTKKPAAKKVAR